MSLNITRRFGEGFVLRNTVKSVLKQQQSVRLELKQKVRNKNGTFYQISVKSNVDSIVLAMANEEVIIVKNETHIVEIASEKCLFIYDAKRRWLDSSIAFEASSGNQVRVLIDAPVTVNIVRDELLKRAA